MLVLTGVLISLTQLKITIVLSDNIVVQLQTITSAKFTIADFIAMTSSFHGNGECSVGIVHLIVAKHLQYVSVLDTNQALEVYKEDTYGDITTFPASSCRH